MLEGRTLARFLVVAMLLLGTAAAETTTSACYVQTGNHNRGMTLNKRFCINDKFAGKSFCDDYPDLVGRYYCGYPGYSPPPTWQYFEKTAWVAVGTMSQHPDGHPEVGIATDWANSASNFASFCQSNVGSLCDATPHDGFRGDGICTSDGWCAECSSGKITSYIHYNSNSGRIEVSSYDLFSTDCGADAACDGKDAGDSCGSGSCDPYIDTRTCSSSGTCPNCPSSCQDSGDCVSGYTCVNNVCTTNAAPPTPTHSSPANESTFHSQSTTLEWSTVTDPESDDVTYWTRYSENGGAYTEVDKGNSTSHNLSGLSWNSDYYWSVRACDPADCSAWSADWRFTPTNDEPPVPALTDEPDTHEAPILLEWSAVVDPDGDNVTYDMRVGTTDGGDDVYGAGGKSETQEELTGESNLTLGTYYWSARACDEWECSDWAASDDFTITNDEPPAPALTDEPDGHATERTLEWSEAVDPDGDDVAYDVRVGTTENGTDVLEASNLTDLNQSISGLTMGETYHWNVRACDEWECGPWSGTDDFTITNDPPPTPAHSSPANGATPHSRSVTLDWDNVTDPDGESVDYMVRYKENGGDYTTLNKSGSTSHDLSFLNWNSDYNWSLQACDPYSCSDWSSDWMFTPTNDAPPLPSIVFEPDGHDTERMLEWNSSNDPDGDDVTYDVRVGSNPNATDVLDVSGVTDNNQSVSSLTMGQIYYWNVRACDEWTCSLWTGTDNFTITNEMPPVPALTDELDTHETDVTLEWSEAVDPDGDGVTYDLRVGTTDGESDVADETGLSSLSHDLFDLTFNQTHYWSVRACDSYDCSDWAETDDFLVGNNPPPAPVVVPEPDTHETSVLLEWEEAVDPDGEDVTYDVRVGTTENATDVLEASNLTDLNQSVSSLSVDQSYYWNVRACDGYGCGVWSGTDSFYIGNEAPLTPPLTGEPDTHNTSALLEWGAVVDPDGDDVTYDIRVGTTENATDFAYHSSLTDLNQSISGLTPRRYYWNVRACDIHDCSPWSGTDSFNMTNDVPSAPALVDEPDTHETAVTLEWENATDPDGDNVTYDVRVGTTENATDVLDETGLEANSTSLSELEYYATYYWSVRGCDPWECGNWSNDSFTVTNTLPSVGLPQFNASTFQYGDTVNCSVTATDDDGDELSASYNVSGPSGEETTGAATCDGASCWTDSLTIYGSKGNWTCFFSVNDGISTMNSSAGNAALVNTPPSIGAVAVETAPFEIFDSVTLRASYSEDENPEDVITATYAAWDSEHEEMPNHVGEMTCEEGQCVAGFSLNGLKGDWNASVQISDGTDTDSNWTSFTMVNSPPDGEMGDLPEAVHFATLDGSADDENLEDNITGYYWELSDDGENFTLLSTDVPYEWNASETLWICGEGATCTVKFSASSSDGENFTTSGTTEIDTLPPAIYGFERTADPIHDGGGVELNATVVDANLETVLFESDWNGTPQNYTPSQEGDVFTISIPSGVLENGQLVKWSVWGNDSANNSAASTEQNFTVVDDEYPQISGLSPENGIELPFSTETINVTFQTHETAICRFETESGAAFDEMNGTFNQTGGLNHSVLFEGLEDGQTYSYYVRCADYWETPNVSPELELVYSVDDSDHTPPTEGDHWVVPSEIETGDEATIYFNWTDNVDVESVTIGYNATGDWANHTASRSGDTYSVTIPGGLLTNGQLVGYNSSAVDVSENENTAVTGVYEFLVNNAVPTVPVPVPEADLYNSTATLLEWDESEDADEDELTYEARVGTTENGTEFGTWTWISQPNLTVQNLQYETTYHWNVRACDPFACSDWSESDSFAVIDTEPPALLQYWKESGEVNESEAIHVYSEWSDNDQLYGHFIEHNSSGYWHNGSTSSFSDGWANHTLDTTGLGSGWISFRVWARDDSGNLAATEQESVKVISHDLAVTDLNVTPEEVYTGEEAIVNAMVENQGGGEENSTVRLWVEGTEKNSTLVSLSPGEEQYVQFNWTPTSLGNLNVTVSIDSVENEMDLLDNSMLQVVEVKSHVDDLWVTLNSPDRVQPSSDFNSKLYVYNMDEEGIDAVQAGLSSPDGITVNTPSPLFIGTVAAYGYNLSIWGATAPGSTGNYTLDANVSQTGLEGENHDVEAIEVKEPESPLLSVDVAFPPLCFAGQDYQVIADVYNYGNETALNTWANLTLPSQLELKTGEDAEKMIGDVANGTTEEVRWNVTALQTGSFSVQVAVSSDEQEDSDNSPVPGPEARLAMSVSAPAKVANGTPFNVSVAVNNSGDGDADDVWINLTLPAEMSCGDLKKKVDVAAGTVETVVFEVDADSPASSASYKIETSFGGPAVYYKQKTKQIEIKVDNKAPDFFSVSGPSQTYDDSSAAISSEWDDEFLSEVYAWHNATGNWTSTFLAEGGSYSLTVPASQLDEGERVEWFFQANDTTGNTNSTPHYVISVVGRDDEEEPVYRSSGSRSRESDVPEEETSEEEDEKQEDAPVEEEPLPSPEPSLEVTIQGSRLDATVGNDGDAVLRADLVVYVDGELKKRQRIEVGAGESSAFSFELDLAPGTHTVVVAVAGEKSSEDVEILEEKKTPQASVVTQDGSSSLQIEIPEGGSGKLLLTLYQDGKEMSQQTLDLSSGTQSVSLDNLLPGEYEANVKLLAEDGSVLYDETIKMEKPREGMAEEPLELNSTLAAIWLMVMAFGVMRILEV